MQDLSQMSTEELLRMRDSARQPAMPAPASPRAPGIIQGRPKAPDPVTPMQAQQMQIAERRLQIAEEGQNKAPSGYRYKPDGSMEVIPGGPADRARDGGAIPVSAANVARESVSQFSALNRALNTFQDDFAGNRAGNWAGELENQAEARFGLGTPGQSEWWADFRATDNLIRNSLFGASLTQGEKTAYEQTTIAPGMSPEKVKANLARRAEIVGGVLAREKEFYLANGYKPEAVEALFEPLTQYLIRPAPMEGEGLDNVVVTDDRPEDPAPVGSGEAAPPSGGGEDPLASSMFGEVGRFMNAFGEVSGEAATLGLADEFRGIGGAIGAALRGEDIGAGYERGRQAQETRSAAAEEYMGAATLPIQLATGGAGGRAASGVQAGMNAARRIATTGAPTTRQAIQRDLTRRAAASGAAIGGVAGAAQGETLQERGTNALLGAGVGGALGGGGQMIGNALANRAAPAATAGAGAATQQSADRLGIDLIPAVTGGTSTRMATSGAKQGFVSARPIDQAVQRMEGQAAAARTGASQSTGNAVDDEAAGELVRQGAKVYAQRTSQIGGQLYERADRRANGVSFPLTNAVRTARQELSELVQAPGGAETPMAKELRDLIGQMGGRTVDVQGVRALKTRLRNEIMQRGLRGSPQDRIYQNVVKAAEDDLIGGLNAAGRTDAAQALKTANAFWKSRVETIDQVLDPLIGKNAPRSGEQILSSLERLARPDSGNASNLRRLMQAMPKDEADAVRATVINRLGRPTAGSANADREGFSFDTFLTNWNNMTPRARATMFPPEARDALTDLAKVSEGVKRAGSSANRSNTAGALTVQAAISAPQVWFLEPLTAVSLTGGQYAAGKLLASPKFARMLARAPRQSTPQARSAFSQRLGNLAQSEPALAQEIGLYQRALAANDNNAVRAVAAEEENQQPR